MSKFLIPNKLSMKTIFLTVTTFIFLGYVTAGATEMTEINFAFIGATDSNAYDGVAQGIHEANLQGRFPGPELYPA